MNFSSWPHQANQGQGRAAQKVGRPNVRLDRPRRIFYADRVLAVLKIHGPMTLEALADWFDRDPYAVNGWLYHLRTQWCVQLIERGQHRNRRGLRCGKWAIVKTESLTLQQKGEVNE